jgi:hypothetical protein
VAGDAASGTKGGSWIIAGEFPDGRQKGSWKVKPRSSPAHRAGTQTYGGRPGGVAHCPATQDQRPAAHHQ